MTKTLELETDRLKIRKLTENDFDKVCRLQSHPEVMCFIGSGQPKTKDQVKQLFNMMLNHQKKHGFSLCPTYEKDSWIIDGNGMRTLEMRFKEADLVIFCAQPLLICYFRIFKRALTGFFLGKKRPDCPEGAANIVTWRLLKYVWGFHSKYGPMINKLHKHYPSIEFIRATSNRDLQTILNRFKGKEEIKS